jgi:hypothetical protein
MLISESPLKTFNTLMIGNKHTYRFRFDDVWAYSYEIKFIQKKYMRSKFKRLLDRFLRVK